MSDSDARDNYSDSSSRDSILKSSRLNISLRSSVLKPSSFTSITHNDTNSSANSNSGNANKLTSTAGTGGGGGNLFEDSCSNPFMKGESEHKIHKSNDQDQDDAKKENNEQKNEKDLIVKEDPLTLLSKNGLPRSNLFAASKTSMPRVEQTGFVFGQNVHERITGAVESLSKQDNESNKQQSGKNENSSNNALEGGSGASELLFSNAIQNNKSDEVLVPKEIVNKSLTEVAREYEESRAQKRKYEEVETFTGEENEVNVIDINCKLFAFINRNWEERGRGCLRLNDSKDKNGCSRVVFRTSGNLRLQVNTKVWSGMVAERPSQKSFRFTAMDNNGQVKLFLIMSRPDDINILHKNLTQRINECGKKDEQIKIDDEKELKTDFKEKCYDNNDNGDEIQQDNNIINKEEIKEENVNDKKETVDDNYEPNPKKLTVEEENLN